MGLCVEKYIGFCEQRYLGMNNKGKSENIQVMPQKPFTRLGKKPSSISSKVNLFRRGHLQPKPAVEVQKCWWKTSSETNHTIHTNESIGFVGFPGSSCSPLVEERQHPNFAINTGVLLFYETELGNHNLSLMEAQTLQREGCRRTSHVSCGLSR